jgi:Zn-dependent M16 (insulinase) family peptidase
MLTQQHIAAIEEAAQTLESAAKHNREMGRTVFAHSQQEKTDKLKEILQFVAESSKTNSAPAGANATAPECSPTESNKAAAANAGGLSVREALRKVLDEMAVLSPEELRAELDRHKDGPMAVALREAGAFLADRTPAADAVVQEGGA